MSTATSLAAPGGQIAERRHDKFDGDSPQAALARDAMLSAYGGVVERRHPNSTWRRDLVYPARGLRLEVRPLTPDDVGREGDFFNAQTSRERFMRFLGATEVLPPALLRRLTHVNFGRDFAVAAVDRETDALVGVARYERWQDDEVASVAVAVLKKYQRLGIARYLMATVFDAARQAGITRLVAEIFTFNYASRLLVERVRRLAGAQHSLVNEDGDVSIYHFRLADLNQAVVGGRSSKTSMPSQPRSAKLFVGSSDAFVLDDHRHPRSLWRHDLIFSSGLRVEVRPLDVDDKVRIAEFAEALVLAGCEHLSQRLSIGDLFDFASGFALVGLDMATDTIVGFAYFHRGEDMSRMDAFTLPAVRSLGLGDFLAKEVLRAALVEVMGCRSAL
mmetsp:Transcript_75445/g.196224  ORF Transcript_75445/g.196224 Transcript_75445/m.196224 type:complete len:389 (-) Transcript_75445:535-1701(-)